MYFINSLNLLKNGSSRVKFAPLVSIQVLTPSFLANLNNQMSYKDAVNFEYKYIEKWFTENNRDLIEKYSKEFDITSSIIDGRVKSSETNNILNMISKIENYDFISEYKKRSIVLNQDIIYTSKGISLIGKAIDIANDGSLIVKNSDGSTKILNSGDITIRKVNE